MKKKISENGLFQRCLFSLASLVVFASKCMFMLPKLIMNIADNSMDMVCSSHQILPQSLSKQGCPENSELGVRSCSSILYLAVLTSSPLPPFSPAPPPSPFRSSDVRTDLTPLTPCSWHILLRGEAACFRMVVLVAGTILTSGDTTATVSRVHC